MSAQFVVLLLVLAVAAIGLYFIAPRSHVALGRFWQRRCEGLAWRRTFPSASPDEVRQFLRLFMDAFALPQARMLRFAPADRVLEIYHAVAPPGWPDSLELETLDSSLQATYGLKLRDVWKDNLTVGELFARAHRMGA